MVIKEQGKTFTICAGLQSGYGIKLKQMLVKGVLWHLKKKNI
jgi:hypothetical protein